MPAARISLIPSARLLAQVFPALALLSACAIGPDYVRPQATMPAAFAHASATVVAEPDIGKWWRQFEDPALTTIIERVLVENLDLAAATARIEQARAVTHRADAELLPIGSANAQVARQHQSLESPLGLLSRNLPGYERNNTLYDIGAGASWEADLFGDLHRRREADSAEEQAVVAEGLAVRISLAAEAADAYFRVRGAQQRIALAEQQVKNDSALCDLVDARLHEGLATRREQVEALARLAQVKSTIPALRTELELQLNRLDVLMAQQPGAAARQLVAASNTSSRPTLNAMPSPDILLRRRPDVIAAERRLAASHARIGVALAEYYPKLSLSALLGFEGLNTASLSSATFQPTAVAGLRWRLFDFGRVDAEVAQAKGATAEALARYRQSMLRAVEDVEAALISRMQLDQEQHELQSEVTADREARDSATEAYRGGVSSLLEVLEQDRQWLSARDRLAVAEIASDRATVAIFRALGGGW